MMKKNVNKAVLLPNSTPTIPQALKADFSRIGYAEFTYAALVGDCLACKLSQKVEIVSGTTPSSPHWHVRRHFQP